MPRSSPTLVTSYLRESSRTHLVPLPGLYESSRTRVGTTEGVLGCDDVINIFELAVILTASTVTITHLAAMPVIDNIYSSCLPIRGRRMHNE